MQKKPPVGRLRPFRLNDIPLDLRVAAARALARKDAALSDDAVDPRDRLFAVLSGNGASREHAALQRVAEHPSPRVYWISEKAYTKVMGS